ncbi:MAG TPA: phage tail tube protein, partial [Tianweitania sediminis]|nr:phage tail tube protein [Tianweitania sediminis]
MAYQSGRNVAVSYKLETEFGQLPGATDAKAFRPNSGQLTLAKEAITSNEIRRDGMSTRGRHGSRSVTGQYAGDLSVGTFDELIEAVFRGTFEAALTIDQDAMASATIAVDANTITAPAGSFIAAGLRVNDVIRLGEGFAAGNQNLNVRIVGLTATTITV